MSTQVRRQTALTRVELLAVIVVIVFLVGLLMPSVSSSREADRRFACINNLRRLGMATHAYHDAHGCFPPMRCGTDRSTHIDDNDGAMSGFVSLLPYFENQEVFDRAKSRNFGPAPWRTDFGTWTVRIPALLCPSDEEITSSNFGNNSYKMCLGTTVLNNNVAAAPGPNGVAYILPTSKAYARVIRTRDLRDGMANTLCLSERRLGDRGVWYDVANVAVNIDAGDLATNQEWWQACWNTATQYNGKRYNDTQVAVFTRGARPGERWADGRPYFSGFTTLVAPNGPSCTVGDGDWSHGVWTATSRHPYIVNVVCCDGAIRQIVERIDLRTWWGLGTRDSGETLGEF